MPTRGSIFDLAEISNVRQRKDRRRMLGLINQDILEQSEILSKFSYCSDFGSMSERQGTGLLNQKSGSSIEGSIPSAPTIFSMSEYLKCRELLPQPYCERGKRAGVQIRVGYA